MKIALRIVGGLIVAVLILAALALVFGMPDLNW